MTKQNQQLLVAAALVAANLGLDAPRQAPQTPTPTPAGQPAAPATGQARAAGTGAQGPPQPMTFFIPRAPSTGKGDGANLGGVLPGRMRIASRLPSAAGRAAAWYVARLPDMQDLRFASCQRARSDWQRTPGTTPTIQRVAQNVAELHGDTIELGADPANALGKQLSRAKPRGEERGRQRRRRYTESARHSLPDHARRLARSPTAADHTCGNYFQQAQRPAAVQLGHSRQAGGGGNGSPGNSTHASRGCGQQNPSSPAAPDFSTASLRAHRRRGRHLPGPSSWPVASGLPRCAERRQGLLPEDVVATGHGSRQSRRAPWSAAAPRASQARAPAATECRARAAPRPS